MQIIDYDKENRELNLDNINIFANKITIVTKKNITNILKNNKNDKINIMLLGDMHSYTFSYNGKKGYEALLLMLKKYDIKNIIFTVSFNTEYGKILPIISNQIDRCFIISHKIDPSIYYDYKLPKNYDILIYGIISSAYPFRKRLFNILTKMKKTTQLRIRIIKKSENIKYKDLAKLINRSWICISTPSKFDYLVKKYFEIAACNSVVAGNMPIQGKQIFGNNYIPLSNNMSDQKIISILKSALKNKQNLKNMSKHMYSVIHNKHIVKRRQKIYSDIYYEIINNIQRSENIYRQPSKKIMNKSPISTKKPIPKRLISTKKPIPKRLISTKKPIPKRLISTKKPIPKRLISTKKPIPKKPTLKKLIVKKRY